jgi:hypothetical protein
LKIVDTGLYQILELVGNWCMFSHFGDELAKEEREAMSPMPMLDIRTDCDHKVCKMYCPPYPTMISKHVMVV